MRQAEARRSDTRELEQLMGFAYHLVLMNELLAGWRLQEIEAAILAAAALAAYGWDDELHGVDAQRIARKLLYPAYEMRLEDVLAALVLGLVNHRIGENNHIATSVAPADQGTVFRIGQDVSDAAGERRVFFAGPYRG